MYWTKEVKDLCTENSKTLLNETEEHTKNWKDILCSWTGINIDKMFILPKATYRFNAIPIKIIWVFTEMKQKLLKLIQNHKTPNNQSNPEIKYKSEAGGITLPDFKLYCKAMVIKRTWYWQKNRHTDQWNRIQSPEINPHVHEQLMYEKGEKYMQQRNDSLFNKWRWENWRATYKRMKLDHSLTPYTKWIKMNWT